MNNTNFLIETNVIEILHHHARTKFAKVTPILRTWASAPLCRRGGKFIRIISNLRLYLQKFRFRVVLWKLAWPE